MSKDIVIQLKGEPQNLNDVEKIELVGVGDELGSTWVPEDETELGEAEFHANGNYKASDYNVYGWQRVVVDVPMELSGTTARGETWTVRVTDNGKPVLNISERT